MTQKVVVFSDLKEAARTERKNLSPILDFHLLELETYAINPASPIEITEDPAEAEYFVLPKYWTCYLWNGKRDMADAIKMAELADRYGKRLIIWFKGDLVPRIPFDNYILFLPGIVKSRQKKNHIASPVFIDDPQPLFGESAKLLRPKNGKPTVGFCGYASTNALKTAWSIASATKLKVYEKMGRGDFEETPILPSTFLRSRVLKSLEKNNSVETDFVIRQSYTPATPRGIETNGNKRVNDFYENMYGTDYTLCMRGYGNWSYRFYQTLACGRIPVFVDTECVLPDIGSADWKEYCVWINSTDIRNAGDIIARFHSAMAAGEFSDLQSACRKLWEEHLTLQGFIPKLFQTIKKLET